MPHHCFLLISKIACGGVNENGSHMFIYLNSWSFVGGSTWEGLGGMVFLEEVCHFE